jgi:hypothetical protein
MQLEIIQNNYIHVPGFLTSGEAESLAEEFKEYCVKFNPKNISDPSTHVNSALNWLPFIALLVQKIPEVSKLIGEPVLPTYTYARWQTTGDALPRHRDRPSCEISLSVNLQKDKDWGLWVQKPNGDEIELILNAGDAVLYLGCQADHWRNKFEGNEHIQVFLHYVRANGPKAWAYFDKQQQQPPTEPTDNFPKTIL